MTLLFINQQNKQKKVVQNKSAGREEYTSVQEDEIEILLKWWGKVYVLERRQVQVEIIFIN